MDIPVVIDHALRVDANYLGADLTEYILNELTLLNPAWKQAQRNKRWNDDLDAIEKHILLAEFDGDTLVLPRGYAYEFKLLLREHGHTVKWIDKRTWRRGSKFGYTRLDLRPHQKVAVRKLRFHQQGIYEAPTGSGKTVAICGLIWESHPESALILVDKIELLHQWQRELRDHIGCSDALIGQIGQGKWNERRFTVATVQTLWRAYKAGKIDEAWFKKWSLVDLDECHHVTADTIMELFSLFWARVRIGNSATPDRQDSKFSISLDVIGDIVHSESESELRAAGLITAPVVHRIVTSFSFPYHRAHQSGKRGECEVEHCKKTTQHSHQNNYQKMREALVTDVMRNSLVASCLLSQVKTGPHIHLVISDWVTHLETLMIFYSRAAKRMGIEIPPTFLVTGKTPRARRKKMIEEVKRLDNAVLFSTVAKEGLDIPYTDRIYLPFPGAQPAATEQKIGRGTRAREGKGETLIFDFADVNVKPLRKAFKNRRVKVYDKLGLEVIL